MSRRRITPGRPLAAEAQRLFANELDAIADALLLARENRDAGLHEARKSIKKARALLKLLHTADPDFHSAEDVRLRDLARSLAHARDAAALVEAVDRLALARPGHAVPLAALKSRLGRRRDDHVIDDAALRTLIDEGLRRSAQMRRDMDRWALPGNAQSAAGVLADGVRRNWKHARRALRNAGRRAADEDFHDLRKAVKAHWTQLGLLDDLWPRKVGKARARFEALGERLGEHNDLAALLQLLRSREVELGRDQRRALTKLAAREKARLARSTLKTARRLLQERPRKLRSAFVEHLQVSASSLIEQPHALGAPHL